VEEPEEDGAAMGDEEASKVIEQIPFGRTGHLSSRVIFGAAAFVHSNDEVSERVLRLLLRYGVNHIDTAAAYGDSEDVIAPWLVDHRDDFFLATKTGDRGGDDARASLERSLTRLGVDSVDLIQLHNLVEEEEWERAFAPGGAVEALAKARDEGLVRFIGVTGHGLRIPGMHLRSLERFPFDSVLFPYNWALMNLPHYRADVDALISVCAEREIATQTIKSIARRRWQERPQAARTWYDPITDHDAVGRAVRFVLGRPGLFVNSSSDYELLEPALAAAAAGEPPPDDLELADDAARFDTAPLFDGIELERI
jgi:aryl-alcohol dehydrogenase-like predicted oxidoreductase